MSTGFNSSQDTKYDWENHKTAEELEYSLRNEPSVIFVIFFFKAPAAAGGSGGTSGSTAPASGSTSGSTAPASGSTSGSTAPASGSTSGSTAPASGSTSGSTAPASGSTSGSAPPAGASPQDLAKENDVLRNMLKNDLASHDEVVYTEVNLSEDPNNKDLANYKKLAQDSMGIDLTLLDQAPVVAVMNRGKKILYSNLCLFSRLV